MKVLFVLLTVNNKMQGGKALWALDVDITAGLTDALEPLFETFVNSWRIGPRGQGRTGKVGAKLK